MKGTILRRLRLSAVGLGALALALAGCGTQNEANAIASDACDALEEFMEGDMQALDDLEDLERRADEAGISDEEMQDALEDECGDMIDEMGTGF